MGLVEGRKILITGISGKLSIAYGIAKVLYQNGAKLAFSCQNERIKSRVEKIARQFESEIVIPCDVSSDENIRIFFSRLEKIWGQFDGFVHSIAYANQNQFRGNYLNVVTRKDFEVAHSISSYSLVEMVKSCRSMLRKGSTVLTITYIGSSLSIPNYNVMGPAKASLESNVRYIASSLKESKIRINAISSGPILTISSSRIRNFRKMHRRFEKNILTEKISIEDIGKCAVFLCSDLSSGINGEIIHVDGGFNFVYGNCFEEE
ncbi:enoyl-ACP reductase [Candidatus Riesia pediculicola]|nr:enoyl-ACP reductase [Candidatus Riesia pediculicola]ARC53655.1 enoyl-ACP reductase [Candidatus Riesia pediculicola]QOJ86654.1 enoyl-ACP reductase [Candidatus Riesia pediculicola]